MDDTMDAQTSNRNTSSFRDPEAHVYQHNGKIFRVLRGQSRKTFEQLETSQFLDKLVKDRWIVNTFRPSEDPLPEVEGLTIQHEKVSFITYPYEWPFSMLKAAALFHLKFHLFLLKNGYTLKDATAYNVQFEGTSPIFIDTPSIKPYVEGEFWLGHHQFCTHFLYPLLSQAQCQTPYNDEYRGTINGIPAEPIFHRMGLKKYFYPNLLMHLTAPYLVSKKFESSSSIESLEKHSSKKLAKSAYEAMLLGLHNWISKLKIKSHKPTTWANYDTNNSYHKDEVKAKEALVREFIIEKSVKSVIDMGCNTGRYSRICRDEGCNTVVAVDSDIDAINVLATNLPSQSIITPLYLNAMTPSPNQGWGLNERLSFQSRLNVEAGLFLAIFHHIAIGNNVPLSMVLDWMTTLVPQGIIEFAKRGDSEINKMLATREDIFIDYQEEHFKQELAKRAKIVKCSEVSSTRTLYQFEQ